MDNGHNVDLEVDAIVRRDGIVQRQYKFIPPRNDARIGIKIFDKTTGKVRVEEERPMKSWVFNWCKFLYYSMTSQTQTFYRTSGASTTTFPYYWNLDLVDTTNSNHGIHAGADDGTITPLSANNYVLGDRYLEGVGLGEMSYDTTVVGTSEIDGEIKFRVRLYRYVNNYSAGDNDVKEISLVGIGQDSNYTTYIRDLFDDFGNPVNYTVGKNEALLVYYDLYILKDSGLTKNIVRWMEAIAKADNTVALKNISNANITASAANTIYDMLNCYVGAGEDNYGVIIGDGASDTNYESYKLVSRIRHGTGAGQLNYAAVSLTAPSHQSGQQQFKIHRYFTNNSGSTITTREIALYGKGTGSGNRTCFARVDMVGVPLENGENVEIVFTIRTLI